MIQVTDLQQGDIIIAVNMMYEALGYYTMEIIAAGLTRDCNKEDYYWAVVRIDNKITQVELDLERITSHMRDGKQQLQSPLVPVKLADFSKANNEKYDAYDERIEALWGLKDALKDASVFVYSHSVNKVLHYDLDTLREWRFSSWCALDHGLPTFTDSSEDDRQEVIDYMNKMFPRGWQV